MIAGLLRDGSTNIIYSDVLAVLSTADRFGRTRNGRYGVSNGDQRTFVLRRYRNCPAPRFRGYITEQVYQGDFVMARGQGC